MFVNHLRISTTTPTALRLGTAPAARAYLGDVLVYGEQDSPALTYLELVLAHMPLLYWRLGDAAGTVAIDSSTHGRDGTYVNAPGLGGLPLVAGDSATSTNFNKASEHRVELSHATWMNSIAATITCVYQCVHTSTVIEALAARHMDGTTDISWRLYRENRELKFMYRTADGQNIVVSSGVICEIGTTYYIAAYAGAGGAGIRVYSLGTLLGSAIGTAASINSSSRPFMVASTDGSERYPATGLLQEVAYFDTVLSATDIDELAMVATTPQPVWTRRTAGVGARDGTAAHTLSFTPASPGALLVAVVTGGVTSTAASPGWTKRLSPVTQVELAVFTCSASGGETSLTLTHNGSNYPINYVVYEFPAGTSWVDGAGNANGWSPALSSLPGTPVVAVTALAMASANLADPAVQADWGYCWTEDVDTMTPYDGVTDGVYLTAGWRQLYTDTSVSPALSGYYGGPVYMLSDQIAVATTVTFAIGLPG